MTTHYSIVQFLPDPSNGERINIGVVAFDEDNRTAFSFLKNWGRVRAFANLKNNGKLENSVDEMITRMDREWIQWAIGGMSHSIQLTPLRVSSLPLSDVVERASRELLIDPPEKHFPKRTRDGLRRKATFAIEKSLSKVYDVDNLVVGRFPIRGEVTSHVFDVAAQNGRLLLAAPVISLIQTSRDNLFRQIGAAAWAIQDVQASKNVKTRALFVISGKGINQDAHEEVKSVFPNYGAEVVEYETVDHWADKFAASVVP